MILGGTLEDLAKMGYEKDECRLCYSVLVGDLDEINKQIEKNTNPTTWISGEFAPGIGRESDGSSYQALASCNKFYCDAFNIYELHNIYDNGLQRFPIDINSNIMLAILQAAFYQDVENRLKTIKY